MEYLATVIVSFGIIRFEYYGLVETLQSPPVLTESTQCIATVVIGFRVMRLEEYGPGGALDSLHVLLQPVQCDATIAIGFCKVRLEYYDLVDQFQRDRVFSCLTLDHSQQMKRFRMG